MRRCRGSFTIEATCILPIVLACIMTVVGLSVSLHSEIVTQIEQRAEKEKIDMIKAMYQREYIKDLLGEVYED